MRSAGPSAGNRKREVCSHCGTGPGSEPERGRIRQTSGFFLCQRGSLSDFISRYENDRGRHQHTEQHFERNAACLPRACNAGRRNGSGLFHQRKAGGCISHRPACAGPLSGYHNRKGKASVRKDAGGRGPCKQNNSGESDGGKSGEGVRQRKVRPP